MWILTHRHRARFHDNERVIEAICNRPFIGRMADGRFALGDERHPQLSVLLARLPEEHRPLSLEMARCAARFDEAAAAANPRGAWAPAHDAFIELSEMADRALGFGSRPRLLDPDFDGVARLIRAGQLSTAMGHAHHSLEVLATRLGRRSPLAPKPEPVPSPLSGWFSDDPDAVRAAIAAWAADADLSMGAMQSAGGIRRSNGWPERGGLHCMRLFGNCLEGRCLCGALFGDAGTCAKCGCTLGPEAMRDVGYAHVDLSRPVLHPAFIADAAERLNMASTALIEGLEGEDGAVLLRRIADAVPDLMVRRVPALPAGMRAPVMRRISGLLATRSSMLDYRLARVINHAVRVRRLAELGAPEIIVASAWIQLQRGVIDYAFSVSDQETMGSLVHRALPCARFEPGFFVPYETPFDEPEAGSLAVVWFEDGRLVLQWSEKLYVLDPGATTPRFVGVGDERVPRFSHGAVLGCLSDAAAVGEGASEERTLIGGAPRTLDGWQERWPADMPCAVFSKDQPEDGWIELPTAGHVEDAYRDSDRPRLFGWTPDGAWIVVGDDGRWDAVDTRQAFRTLVPAKAEAEHVLLGDADFDGEDCWGAAAFVLTPAGWYVLEPSGVFAIDGVGQWRLGFQAQAAGFSHDARRLAVMDEDETVHVIDCLTGAVTLSVPRPD
jgi:hypothetical protein